MKTAVFLLSALVISLSGVMAPGAVTAATIGQGATRKYAGVLIAVGHGIIEFPLMFFIILGFGAIIRSPAAQAAIGLIGGLFLLWMGSGMIREVVRRNMHAGTYRKSGPVLTGFLLSAGNPYFLLWWATVGLKLATDARHLGWTAFVLFTIIHWLCDLVWLGLLGFVSFGGSRVFRGRLKQVVMAVCGGALVLFGVRFIYSAGALWLATV